MTTTTAPLSAQLKHQTQPLHTLAEQHPFQRAMVSGRLGRPGYRAYLDQMLHVHSALESALSDRIAAGSAPLAAMVKDYHFRVEQLAADTAFLGGPAAAPSPAAREFSAWIVTEAAADPRLLIGVLYVLEGSTNGGRFIAKALRRTLNLEAAGTAYLDPHGEAQAERWGRFKADLDALGFDQADATVAIAGAARTFEAIIAVSADLAADLAPASPVA